MTTKNQAFTGKLAFAIAASAISPAFQHGYHTGVVNNPKIIVEEWMSNVLGNRTNSTPTNQTITMLWSSCVAVFCVGGVIGGGMIGFVSSRFGRKGGLNLSINIYLLAILLILLTRWAQSFEILIIARLLIGIYCGLSAGLAPMYLNEIAPIRLRGAICTVYQLVITFSILISQILGSPQMLGTKKLWNILFAFGGLLTVIQIFLLPMCPESPKYLVASKLDMDKAQRALIWLRKTDDVKNELEAIKAETVASALLPEITYRQLISNSALRQPLCIALVVMLAQQLCGINAIMFYSTSIFVKAGFDSDRATYGTLGMGTINVLITIASLFLVDVLGRKTLLLVGFVGITVVTTALCIVLAYVDTAPILKYSCIGLLFLFVVMFAIGPGSIPWFLVTELFGQKARASATSLAVATNWIANFAVGIAFLPIQASIQGYVFLIFVILDVFFVLFIIVKVPETRNKTSTEISNLFQKPRVILHENT